MKGPYDDIINLPHHVSAARKKMSMTDRAAQFSPFAALKGYEDSIEEMRRVTDCGAEIDMDGAAMLNEKISLLSQNQKAHPEVTVIYFQPDERKRGGAYCCVTGELKKIDAYQKLLILEDGTAIGFEQLHDIHAEGLMDF